MSGAREDRSDDAATNEKVLATYVDIKYARNLGSSSAASNDPSSSFSIECNPKEPYGWNGAGVCLEALGKDGGECFKVAKGMSSDNEGWLNAVVRDYRRGEDVEKSLEDLTGVSEHALSWLVRGLDLRRRGLKGGGESARGLERGAKR